MEIRTVIIIAIIIIALVVGYMFLTGHKNTTTTTTIPKNINGTTSMTVPPYITTYNSVAGSSNNYTNLTGENIKLEYSGSMVKNGVQCQEISKAITMNQKYRTPAYTNFTFYFYVASTNCNFTITRLGIDNAGFKIVNTQPLLPYFLPVQSEIQESVTVTAPGYNFTGPLSVTVYAK